MESAGKTEKQLIDELEKANQRIAELEASAVDMKHKEARLLDSEGMFRAILDAAQDSIFVKDLQLRYTHVNPAMERLFSTPTKTFLLATLPASLKT